jgi:hypothetical protein
MKYLATTYFVKTELTTQKYKQPETSNPIFETVRVFSHPLASAALIGISDASSDSPSES